MHDACAEHLVLASSLARYHFFEPFHVLISYVQINRKPSILTTENKLTTFYYDIFQ